MQVNEAVSIAKAWVSEIMKDEGIINLGLEEVSLDGENWRITLGFSRPWNTVRNAMTIISGDAAPRRAFRVITVRDTDGTVVSMKKNSDE